MDAVATKLLDYFQKNTLWQFFSRDWDRKENLDGMFEALGRMVQKQAPLRETPAQKAFHAESTVMLQEIREKVPEFAGIPPEAAAAALEIVKKELWDIVITHSKNEELTAELY